MVEEEEDIANVDMSKISADAQPLVAKKEETPKPVAASKQPEAAKASGSAVGSSEFMEELEHMIHSG